MNALQQLNLDGVQLMRVRLEQSFVKMDAVPNKTNDTHVVLGHPAMMTEKIHITLDARDSSASPGDQVNKFKEVIAQPALFQIKPEPDQWGPARQPVAGAKRLGWQAVCAVYPGMGFTQQPNNR